MANQTDEYPLNGSERHNTGRSVMEVLKSRWKRVLEGGRYILGPEVECLEEEVAALCGVGSRW